MTAAEALQKLADAAKAAQAEPSLRPSTRFACVCLSWAPRWVEQKGHSYAAGYLAALHGSNRFIPEPDQMHDTIVSALWMASELLEHSFHASDAPANQIESAVADLGLMTEDYVAPVENGADMAKAG